MRWESPRPSCLLIANSDVRLQTPGRHGPHPSSTATSRDCRTRTASLAALFATTADSLKRTAFRHFRSHPRSLPSGSTTSARRSTGTSTPTSALLRRSWSSKACRRFGRISRFISSFLTSIQDRSRSINSSRSASLQPASRLVLSDAYSPNRSRFAGSYQPPKAAPSVFRKKKRTTKRTRVAKSSAIVLSSDDDESREDDDGEYRSSALEPASATSGDESGDESEPAARKGSSRDVVSSASELSW